MRVACEYQMTQTRPELESTPHGHIGLLGFRRKNAESVPWLSGRHCAPLEASLDCGGRNVFHTRRAKDMLWEVREQREFL